jgi:exodeoxyribonuclease V
MSRARNPKLTPRQKSAFDALFARIEAGERYSTLRGYAGTGKTYLLGQVVDRLCKEKRIVKVCAPTHKAAQVLQDRIQDAAVRAQTIHAFLGLRLVPDNLGGYKLEAERNRIVPRDAVVVVDEASMVGSSEWEHIEQAEGLQWLFVGDPAQLPPVNEEPSHIFDIEGPELDEIVRQAKGNPILDLATKIRHREPYLDRINFLNGEGVGATGSRSAFVESALRAFSSKDFAEDGSFARLLAYRNRTVASYNRTVRRRLYGDEVPRFVKGELLVAHATWFSDGIPYLINSEEVRVRDASIEEVGHLDGEVWKVWELEIRGARDRSSRYILVLHEDDERRFRDRLARLKKVAIDEKKDWKPYYKLREQFASVDYGYAMTVHKSQGSTFDTVFVDHRDTTACRGHERHALLYVGVTRPSRRLALLV